MNWGSGSSMQIITAIKDTDNNDSLFLIKEAHGKEPIETGTPVKCNDVVRLEHINTAKNLHSHSFPSFITDSQEVCGFGGDGEGDVNDNWRIVCYNYQGPALKGSTSFFLYHVGTQQYLYINIKKSLFNEHNCRNCPILNHREVSCTTNKDKQSLWKVIGGILYANNNEENDKVEVKTEDL